MDDVEEKDVEELLLHYARAAREHGEATEAGEPTSANKAQKVVAAVYRELRRRGVEAQRALLRLLDDPNTGVRLWAASHALEFSPGEGEPVLVAMSTTPKSFLSFSAKMTLKQWHEGKLRFT